MKKITVLFISLAMSALLIAGCGTTHGGVEGLWRPVSESGGAVSSDMTMEFKGGGTVTVSDRGGSIDGTWSQSGGSVSMNVNGVDAKGTVSGNTLEVEDSAGVKAVFEKQ